MADIWARTTVAIVSQGSGPFHIHGVRLPPFQVVPIKKAMLKVWGSEKGGRKHIAFIKKSMNKVFSVSNHSSCGEHLRHARHNRGLYVDAAPTCCFKTSLPYSSPSVCKR